MTGAPAASTTVGVDLAAQPARSVIATLEWALGTARCTSIVTPAHDADIVKAVLSADVAGIDVPLGWPEAFWAFLTEHRDDAQSPLEAGGWRELAFRRTDAFVAQAYGQTPLSVSTDRLGLTAIRAATVLALLREQGLVVDRTGAGKVCEAYPAAALRQWGLPFRGYKNADPLPLAGAVDQLLAAAPWLDLGVHEVACRSSHDVFDAVIAALIARARQLGAWQSPVGEDVDVARREGWIVVPTCALGALA